MAKIDLASFEITVLNLFFQMDLEASVSKDLMIAAFETYGLLVNRLGAVEMGFTLYTDIFDLLSFKANFFVILTF